MNQRPAIDKFFKAKKIAVAGVSRNRHKFGSAVYRELHKKGYDVIPVNPNMVNFEGDRCYNDISSLPEDVDALICVVKPDVTEKLVKQASEAGIKNIWLQQGSESEAAVSWCRENGVPAVSKACIFMYAEPVASIHKFHRGIAKLFGKYEK